MSWGMQYTFTQTDQLLDEPWQNQAPKQCESFWPRPSWYFGCLLKKSCHEYRGEYFVTWPSWSYLSAEKNSIEIGPWTKKLSECREFQTDACQNIHPCLVVLWLLKAKARSHYYALLQLLLTIFFCYYWSLRAYKSVHISDRFDKKTNKKCLAL